MKHQSINRKRRYLYQPMIGKFLGLLHDLLPTSFKVLRYSPLRWRIAPDCTDFRYRASADSFPVLREFLSQYPFEDTTIFYGLYLYGFAGRHGYPRYAFYDYYPEKTVGEEQMQRLMKCSVLRLYLYIQRGNRLWGEEDDWKYLWWLRKEIYRTHPSCYAHYEKEDLAKVSWIYHAFLDFNPKSAQYFLQNLQHNAQVANYMKLSETNTIYTRYREPKPWEDRESPNFLPKSIWECSDAYFVGE